jgi:hypothetical protein
MEGLVMNDDSTKIFVQAGFSPAAIDALDSFRASQRTDRRNMPSRAEVVRRATDELLRRAKIGATAADHHA